MADDAMMYGRAGIFSSPSKSKLFWTSAAHYVPMGISEWCYANFPGKGLDKARQNRRAAHKVARRLLDLKSDALLSSKGSRDVMSIIGMHIIDLPVCW